MLKCEIKDIEAAAKEILNLAESKSEVSSKFQELQASLQCESLSYCLEKYINSELDSKTPGDKGLGRMTTVIPRLGAYYRKQMAGLQSKDLSELNGLIQRIILRILRILQILVGLARSFHDFCNNFRVNCRIFVRMGNSVRNLLLLLGAIVGGICGLIWGIIRICRIFCGVFVLLLL